MTWLQNIPSEELVPAGFAIAPANQSQLVVTGLDGDRDGAYYVEFNIINAETPTSREFLFLPNQPALGASIGTSAKACKNGESTSLDSGTNLGVAMYTCPQATLTGWFWFICVADLIHTGVANLAATYGQASSTDIATSSFNWNQMGFWEPSANLTAITLRCTEANPPEPPSIPTLFDGIGEGSTIQVFCRGKRRAG